MTDIDWTYGDWCCALADASGGTVRAEHVAETMAADEGEAGGREWLALLKLTDGRCAFLRARCSATGWADFAEGEVSFAPDFARLIEGRMGDAERARLGLSA